MGFSRDTAIVTAASGTRQTAAWARAPWLSVIMPTYNGQRYLAAALDSLVEQGDDRFEVIAVDDGSTDGTLDILGQYARKMPLRVERRAHVGNWVANTNLGLALASGEYACVLHQDDCWLPGRLTTLSAMLDRAPDAVLALSPSRYIDQASRTLGIWRCPLPRHGRPLPPALVVERLLVQNFVSMPAPVFRRQAALELGGLSPDLWYTADWDLWLKLAAFGPTLYTPQPLSCFRVHGQSQTIRSSIAGDEFRRQLETVWPDHAGRWEAGGRELSSSARRAARFSIEVNVALAAAFHGRRGGLADLLLRGLCLGPRSWYRYLRDSRLLERVAARCRAGMARQPG